MLATFAMPPSRDRTEANKSKDDRSKGSEKHDKHDVDKRSRRRDESEPPVLPKCSVGTREPCQQDSAEISATGTTHCPARGTQDGGAQGGSDLSDLAMKVDQLFTLFGGLAQSMQTMQDPPRSTRNPPHDMSDGEVSSDDNSCHSDDDKDPPQHDPQFNEIQGNATDPLAMYAAQSHNDGPSSSTGEFDEAVASLAKFFHSSSEVTGKDITSNLADALNPSLRLKPHDGSIKELAAKYPYPGNVPHLKVPKTNPDIVVDLWKGSQYLDLLIQKCQMMTSKALVPMLTLLDEMRNNPSKPISSFTGPMHDSLRLLTASFNCMSQARKDVVRNNFRDAKLAKLCTWETPVGSDLLFDFDVLAKVSSLKKTPSLRDMLRKSRKPLKPYHNPRRPLHPQAGTSSGSNFYHSYNRPSSNNSRKPFLGHNTYRNKGKAKARKD